MPRFHVAPAYWPFNSNVATDIEADTEKRAAEVYLEHYLADLDYPQQVYIRVLPFDSTMVLFNVLVESVPVATARPVP